MLHTGPAKGLGREESGDQDERRSIVATSRSGLNRTCFLVSMFASTIAVAGVVVLAVIVASHVASSEEHPCGAPPGAALLGTTNTTGAADHNVSGTPTPYHPNGTASSNATATVTAPSNATANATSTLAPACVLRGAPAVVSVVVFLDQASGNVTAVDGTSGDVLASSPTNASAVINAGISALPRDSGGTVILRSGVYNLSHSIQIERHSVEIRGENGGGDSFFTADAGYPGFRNKMGTVLVAPSGVDAIQIGMRSFVFGIAVTNVGITGLESDERAGLPADDVWSAGSGIRAQRVDTFRIEGVQVVRKEFGVRLGPVGPFAYDNVMDVVTVRTLMVSYCGFGLFASGWVANVRIRGLFGYLNQWGLLHKSGTIGQYDWVIDGVTSQADAWNAASVPSGFQATPLYLATAQELVVSNVVVEALKGSTLAAVPLLQVVVSRAGTPGDEWYRGHVLLRHVSAFSTAADAVRVVGTGVLDMTDCQFGSTGSQAFTGGDGRIMNHIVRSYGPDVAVSMTRGFARSELVDHQLWFIGVESLRHVRGVNPVGAIATPFYSAAQRLSPAKVTATEPGASAPIALTPYTVYGTDMIVSISPPNPSPTGGANVTVLGPHGHTVLVAAARLEAMTVRAGFTLVVGAENCTAVVFGL